VNGKPLSEQGNANTQFNLGAMYDERQGVPQNYKTAVKWYKRAAKQRHANVQFYLGGKLRDTVVKQMTPSKIEKA
jgi:TPR repeat protein